MPRLAFASENARTSLRQEINNERLYKDEMENDRSGTDDAGGIDEHASGRRASARRRKQSVFKRELHRTLRARCFRGGRRSSATRARADANAIRRPAAASTHHRNHAELFISSQR